MRYEIKIEDKETGEIQVMESDGFHLLYKADEDHIGCMQYFKNLKPMDVISMLATMDNTVKESPLDKLTDRLDTALTQLFENIMGGGTNKL